MMIPVTERLAIDEADLQENFIAASGPGGQNVNKVATAVQLRFDLMRCTGLPGAVKTRLRTLAGRRLNQDGVIVITANRFRTQGQNREDARARLLEMIREAAVAPVLRKPTRPTKASKTRRLEAKGARSETKRLRRGPGVIA
jgi:ribosome-associated protein